MRLGVRCVSVYAFAIENFKRSPEEVNALMDLAERKMLELCEHGYVLADCISLKYIHILDRDLLDQYGIRLNVLGNKSLLPERVQLAAKKAENLTQKNNRWLNFVIMLCGCIEYVLLLGRCLTCACHTHRKMRSRPQFGRVYRNR